MQVLHKVTVQDISGNGDIGAESVVVSGGYEGDEDHAGEILHAGAGGSDPRLGRLSGSPLDSSGLLARAQKGGWFRLILGWSCLQARIAASRTS
jgi:hypothetical protein